MAMVRSYLVLLIMEQRKRLAISTIWVRMLPMVLDRFAELKDASKTVMDVCSTKEQLARADANGDGKLSPVDAALIYAYANGKITEFPKH